LFGGDVDIAAQWTKERDVSRRNGQRLVIDKVARLRRVA
jgi:hypothetical protein